MYFLFSIFLFVEIKIKFQTNLNMMKYGCKYQHCKTELKKLLTTMIGLKTRHAVCRIMFKLCPTFFEMAIKFVFKRSEKLGFSMTFLNL